MSFADGLTTKVLWEGGAFAESRVGLEAANLPTTTRLYDLRHTRANLLFDAGENPKVVAGRLRRTSVAFPLNNYGHL